MSLSAPPRAAAAPPTAPRPWREIIAPYAKPSGRHATTQLLNTGLPFLVIMAALFCGLDHGIWATLLLALPAAVSVIATGVIVLGLFSHLGKEHPRQVRRAINLFERGLHYGAKRIIHQPPQ